MSVFAGIDLNSNMVDIALIDEDTGDATWIRRRIDTGRKGTDAFQRARRLRDALPARSSWTDAGVIAIGIEKPMSQSFTSASSQMRVQGALLACLPAGIPIYEFVPSRWKKRSIGHGNATKTDGATWARQHIRWTNDRGHIPQDAIDAACIAEACRVTHYAELAANAA